MQTEDPNRSCARSRRRSSDALRGGARASPRKISAGAPGKGMEGGHAPPPRFSAGNGPLFRNDRGARRSAEADFPCLARGRMVEFAANNCDLTIRRRPPPENGQTFTKRDTCRRALRARPGSFLLQGRLAVPQVESNRGAPPFLPSLRLRFPPTPRDGGERPDRKPRRHTRPAPEPGEESASRRQLNPSRTRARKEREQP